MKHAVTHSPRALTAIAAVLALTAIPAASATAQEVAAPSLSLPQDVTTGSPAQAATATPTTPTVTLPPEATAPMNTPNNTTTTAGTSPQPVPQSAAPTTQQTVVLPDTPPPAAPVEAAAEPAPAPVRTASRTTRAAPARVAEAAPVPPSVPTAQSNGTAADGALAEGAVPPAVPAPARADAPPPPAAAAPAGQGNDLPIAGIAGLLAALGIAGLGIAAMRRRREPRYEYDEAEYATDAVAAEPAPVVDVAPAVVGGTFVEEPVRPAMPAAYAPSQMAAGSATAVMAATPLPETADERRYLLDRMVDAEPDEDNPFTSRKSRLRRARVQLQHREHQAELQGQSFDFRRYRPSSQTTGQTTPATPDLIDA